jgi:hypothetical protein
MCDFLLRCTTPVYPGASFGTSSIERIGCVGASKNGEAACLARSASDLLSGRMVGERIASS